MNAHTRKALAGLHMLVAVALVAALLTGCASAPPRVEIQPVNVAVPVACQEKEPERPVMPTASLRPGATVDQFTQAAQAEIERREGYEGLLRTALAACTKPIGPLP